MTFENSQEYVTVWYTTGWKAGTMVGSKKVLPCRWVSG